jgi:hypothetical protein
VRLVARANIKLLRPADFNERLRKHDVDKRMTVQRICKACRGEQQVRELLDEIWNQPVKVQQLLIEVLSRNQNVFKFEKALVSGAMNTACKEQIQLGTCYGKQLLVCCGYQMQS